MSEPPRSLPPTMLERLGVITSRLAPGSAGGMTRNALSTRNTAHPMSATSSGGVVAAIGRYSCSTTLAAGSILVMDTLTSSYGPIEDHITINGDGTLGMLTQGMYQISGGGSVGAAPGTLCGLSVNPFIAQPKPSIANRSDSDAGGQANLQCSAPPFFNDTAGNEIQASVSPDGSVTNPFIALYVVKFVD